MINFRRILFPVDMSDQDKQAAPFVKAMAHRFGSEIVILYVQEFQYPLYAAPEALTAESVELMQVVREQQQSAFESFIAAEFSGANRQKVLVEGNPAQEIVAYASKNDIGLIMLPTHGYGPFRRFLLGSVTAKVLHDAACPVCTGVHSPEPQKENPERCDLLLCAIDTDSRAARIIRWAAEFAREQLCDVQLVHAIPAAENPDDASDQPSLESLFKSAHEQIAGLQKEAGTSFAVTIRGGKPERVVHDLAQDLNTDLVVIGRGDLAAPLGRLRTHAYSIIRESPRPVISI